MDSLAVDGEKNEKTWKDAPESKQWYKLELWTMPFQAQNDLVLPDKQM